MEESKKQHLDFIQNNISRMSNCSFQIKGWCITVVSALLAIFASTQNPCFILVAIVPDILFFFLDGYYLSQERKFRDIYNDVAGITDGKLIKPYEMNLKIIKNKKSTYLRALLSVPSLILYFIILSVLIFLFLYLKNC